MGGLAGSCGPLLRAEGHLSETALRGCLIRAASAQPRCLPLHAPTLVKNWACRNAGGLAPLHWQKVFSSQFDLVYDAAGAQVWSCFLAGKVFFGAFLIHVYCLGRRLGRRSASRSVWRRGVPCRRLALMAAAWLQTWSRATRMVTVPWKSVAIFGVVSQRKSAHPHPTGSRERHRGGVTQA